MNNLLNTKFMKNYFFTITISAMMALSVGLSAQPAGALDPTFANNGLYVLDIGFVDLFTDVEIQNDQKIVAVGITYNQSFVASAQAYRFLPDGSPDLSFGNGGSFTYSLNFEANVYGCAIRENGKIVMAGSTTDYNGYKILLIQLNENGTLDETFGNGGVVVLKIGPDINNFEDHAYAIALQDDGMIVIAGKSYNENYQFVPVVVRFTETGALDTSFGTGGIASIPVIEVENDFDCIVIQDDGKIVASGHFANTFLSFAMLVVRFMPDGSLDASFGNNGIFNNAYSGVDDEGFGITLTSDDQILVTGFTTTAGYDYSMLLMKLDSQGNLAADFGNGGFVEANYGQYDIGYGIYVQGDEKIIVAGTTGELVPGNCNMAIWRYNPDGTLDNTFGLDGMSIIQISEGPDEGLAMAHQNDGKVVIAGKSYNNIYDYAIVRILNDFSTGIPQNETTTFSIAPNPVAQNSNLMVTYELSTPDNIQIEIINALGATTSVIELGYQNAGRQTSNFTIPSAMGQGVYYIRVRGKGYEGTVSKLIVTK
jgi:uncharacterized delta-60 repeat protein